MAQTSMTARNDAGSPEVERSAYNAAFYELGLGWHWSADTFETLQSRADPCERIRHYMEQHHPHLLRAYDAEFLASAIESRLAELRRADARDPRMPARDFGAFESQTGF